MVNELAALASLLNRGTETESVQPKQQCTLARRRSNGGVVDERAANTSVLERTRAYFIPLTFCGPSIKYPV